MSVHLRKKKIANGKVSLYLDFYPPIRKGDGKFTRREFLNRYLYEKPMTLDEKNHNKEKFSLKNSTLKTSTWSSITK